MRPRSGLRQLVGEGEIKEIFDILKERTIAFDNQTWNRRYRGFMDKIKTGSIYDVAEVLRDLYRLKTDKQLSFGERRMLDTARGTHRERNRDRARPHRRQGEVGHRSDLRFELIVRFSNRTCEPQRAAEPTRAGGVSRLCRHELRSGPETSDELFYLQPRFAKRKTSRGPFRGRRIPTTSSCSRTPATAASTRRRTSFGVAHDGRDGCPRRRALANARRGRR